LPKLSELISKFLELGSDKLSLIRSMDNWRSH